MLLSLYAMQVLLTFNQATFLPSLTRLACSSCEPGNLHAHIATSAIKPPLHSTALGLPVVNQSTATLELIVTKHKVFELGREDSLLSPTTLGTGQTVYDS